MGGKNELVLLRQQLCRSLGEGNGVIWLVHTTRMAEGKQNKRHYLEEASYCVHKWVRRVTVLTGCKRFCALYSCQYSVYLAHYNVIYIIIKKRTSIIRNTTTQMSRYPTSTGAEAHLQQLANCIHQLWSSAVQEDQSSGA